MLQSEDERPIRLARNKRVCSYSPHRYFILISTTVCEWEGHNYTAWTK